MDAAERRKTRRRSLLSISCATSLSVKRNETIWQRQELPEHQSLSGQSVHVWARPDKLRPVASFDSTAKEVVTEPSTMHSGKGRSDEVLIVRPLSDSTPALADVSVCASENIRTLWAMHSCQVENSTRNDVFREARIDDCKKASFVEIAARHGPDHDEAIEPT